MKTIITLINLFCFQKWYKINMFRPFKSITDALKGEKLILYNKMWLKLYFKWIKQGWQHPSLVKHKKKREQVNYRVFTQWSKKY